MLEGVGRLLPCHSFYYTVMKKINIYGWECIHVPGVMSAQISVWARPPHTPTPLYEFQNLIDKIMGDWADKQDYWSYDVDTEKLSHVLNSYELQWRADHNRSGGFILDLDFKSSPFVITVRKTLTIPRDWDQQSLIAYLDGMAVTYK